MAEALGPVRGEDAMRDLGARLARLLRPGDIIALCGGLGAGKTTLARGMVQGLGHGGEVPSPTFALVQPYDPPDVRLAVAHVDLYRLETPGDCAQLGLDEYLVEGALIIEWPERLGDALWPDALRLTIEPLGADARCLTAQVPAAWKDRWPPT